MSDGNRPTHTREECDEDGNVRARWHVYVKDGEDVAHGEFELFHPNGMRAEQRFYEDGEPAGVWAMWDNLGRELRKGPPLEYGDAAAPEPSEEDWRQPLVEDDPDRPRLPWHEYSIEFGIVMLVGWLVNFLVAVVSQGFLGAPEEFATITERSDISFIIGEVPAMGSSLQVFLVLLWIIWKSDLSWQDVGLVKPKFLYFAVLGTVLAAVSLYVDVALFKLFDPPEPPVWFVYPVKPFFWNVLVVSLLLNSLAEELVWRGYVLKRLTQMSGSKLFALGLSTVLFASYHVYQGFENMMLVIPFGLLMGASVLVTRRLWPAVVAHTIYNFVLYTALGDWLFA